MFASAPEVVAYADWGVANLDVLPFCYARSTPEAVDAKKKQ